PHGRTAALLLENDFALEESICNRDGIQIENACTLQAARTRLVDLAKRSRGTAQPIKITTNNGAVHEKERGANDISRVCVPASTMTPRTTWLTRCIGVGTPSTVADQPGCHTSLITTMPVA